MHAHITDDAVAIFHKRPPSARVGDFIIWAHRGRPGPHLPVKVFWRSGIGWIAAGAHVIVTAYLDKPDFSEPAFFDYSVACFNQVGCAAPLHIDLHDPFILSRCRQHSLPLDDVRAAGL